MPVGGQERGLVDAELAHPADPAGVVDQRGAVLDDRVHDRPPTHPELLGELGHRPGVAHRPGGTPRHRPGGSAPPGRRRARRSRSTSCASHNGSRQRHRRLRHTSRAGRPKHARSRTATRHPILRLGPHAAAVAARERRCRLDPITTTSASSRSPRAPGTRAVPTAPQPDRYRRSSSGVSSSLQPSDSRNDGGTPAPRGGPSATSTQPRSPLQREEPAICTHPSGRARERRLMAQAIFGIIGVIVGGLLTAVAQWHSERSRLRRDTIAASRLVRHELAQAYEVLRFAVDRESVAIIADTPIPLDRFNAAQGLLAAELNSEQWETISKAYRGIDFVNNAARRHEGIDDEELGRFDSQNASMVASDVSEALGAVNPIAGKTFSSQESGPGEN